jgi:anti-sigma regulatory factor (Ser/Thr protein kinase)
MELATNLPVVPRAAKRARKALAPLGSVIPQLVLDDLRIVVTELVTNSIRHSGTGKGQEIKLQVTATPKRVRVEVIDEGHQFAPHVQEAGLDRSSGWGFRLVDKLCARWGVHPVDGVQVWAEIDLS